MYKKGLRKELVPSVLSYPFFQLLKKNAHKKPSMQITPLITERSVYTIDNFFSVGLELFLCSEVVRYFVKKY